MSKEIINKAINYYSKISNFQYIEVPWVVSEDILNITMPCFCEKQTNKSIVASAEQSFLSEILYNNLKPGFYCSFSACHRPKDNINDGLHFPVFSKVELMHYSNTCLHKEGYLLMSIIETCKKFMEDIRKEKLFIVNTVDDARFGCDTIVSYDIETASGVEMGSYGIRKMHDRNDINWIYATGVALPRIKYGITIND
jgi:hypothetical protein